MATRRSARLQGLPAPEMELMGRRQLMVRRKPFLNHAHGHPDSASGRAAQELGHKSDASLCGGSSQAEASASKTHRRRRTRKTEAHTHGKSPPRDHDISVAEAYALSPQMTAHTHVKSPPGNILVVQLTDPPPKPRGRRWRSGVLQPILPAVEVSPKAHQKSPHGSEGSDSLFHELTAGSPGSDSLFDELTANHAKDHT